MTNVDRWVANARATGTALIPASIPFPQTRAYVTKVEAATKTYRHDYAKLLGRRDPARQRTRPAPSTRLRYSTDAAIPP